MKAILFYCCVFSFIALFESCLGTTPSEEFTQQSTDNYYEETPKGTLMYDFSDNETFESFIEKFSLDSLFQESRVVFPLKKKYLKKNLMEAEELVEAKNWWRVILEATDKYSMRYFENKKVNQGVVEFRGMENRISLTYIFELKDGEWFLVEMEDLSTEGIL
ncbi:MAG: DUF4348 domain-containing protein [Saprospiraceae bacterium]